jgi:hypothetical protein
VAELRARTSGRSRSSFGRSEGRAHAGDAFKEAMSAPHATTNVGKTPVRILATFLEATSP